MSCGTRTSATGTRRIYRCTPAGQKPHKFHVLETLSEAVPLWSPPPRCDEHPDGHVIRDGKYAKSTERERQRYRCFPDLTNRKVFHSFTPSLPRDHVHTGKESCEVCDELRGTHRGEQSASRRQSWSVRVVADALRDVAAGKSYAEVSKKAWKVTGRTRSRASRSATSSSPATSDVTQNDDPFAQPIDEAQAVTKVPTDADISRNRWHTAADWVEVYGPVLWDEVSRRVRAEGEAAVQLRAEQLKAGRHPDPVVVIIDSIPVYSRPGRRQDEKKSKALFSVLALTEVIWRKSGDEVVGRTHRLRLVRAFPAPDHWSWKLLFAELGYTPDVIVSDYDSAQLKACREFFRDAPTTPLVIPSLWHVRRNVENALLESKHTTYVSGQDGGERLRPELADHLSQLSRAGLQGLTSEWWDQLFDKLLALHAPIDLVASRRRNYETLIEAALPLVERFPMVPLSTASVEEALRKRVGPLLENRGHAFRNLERTNRLFDLVVCAEYGLFHDMNEIVRLLRQDGANANGWSAPLREVSDIQPPATAGEFKRYASLRDPLLPREAARRQGVA